MAMTLEQALAFRLPNGKTMGEASKEDWQEAVEFFEAENDRYNELDPITMTQEDRDQIQASLDRHNEWEEANSAIEKEMRRRGIE
jgi:hypothetical protein